PSKYGSDDPQDLHSFPTRRSSDLAVAVRYAAESQTHSRAVSLGSVSQLTLACWIKISVDRNANQVWLSLDNGNSSYWCVGTDSEDRKSTRLNSSHVKISYAVFWLK